MNHLTTHPCVDCGETNALFLEFDHKEPNKKIMGIPQAVYKMGFDRFKEEINKCDIRCANDHKKRHILERISTREASLE